MNHIYKVIFNKATGTFMAVAEYAKSHSGGSSSSTAGQVGSSPVICLTRVATLAILAITVMFNSTTPAAAAAGGVAVSTSSGSNSSNSSNNGNDINAHAEGDYTVAVGKSSHAKGAQSIAIGGGDGSMGKRDQAGAKAKGEESIAIGGDVTADGDASIAIGSDDLYLNNKNGSPKHTSGPIKTLIDNHRVLKQIRDSTNNTTKYRRTKAEGHASTAVGTMAYAKGHFSNAFGTRSTAEGNYSLAVGLTAEAKNGYTIAVGSNARAINYGALAIGTDTQVNLDYGIALGYGSKILNNNNNNNNNAYMPNASDSSGFQIQSSHKATTNGLFSIGSSSIKRKIINVGAGNDDTDAVNVAQLKAAVALANRKITFTGDSGGGVQKGLNETLTIKGGETADNKLADGNNIGVVKDNNSGLKVKLAKTLTGLEAVNTQNLTATGTITVNAGTNTAKLLNSGLTFSSSNPPATNSKTVYGIDGVKFTDNAGTATVGATRITKNEIGFDDASGSVDKNSPYLDNKKLQVGKVEITKDSGINAGNQEITKVKSAITKETEDQQKGINEDNAFVKGLEKAAENTNKQNSAVTVSDLNTVAQTPINFKGDDVTTIVRLGETLPIVGGISSLNALTDDDNIGVVSHGKDALKVRLAKDLKSLNSVNTKTLTATDKITVGSGTNNAELLNSGLTFTQQVGAGKTVYGIDGVKFTDGSNATIEGTTRIDKDKIGFAKADGTVDDNLPHLSKDGIHAGGKAITGLPSTLPSITNAAGVRTTNQGNIITKDEDKSKAASIGDILNTGFNLKNNGEDKDFVSTYDTVDFIDGNATTAKVTYDEANQTSKVAYDVNVDNKTIELTGDNGKKNKIGVKTTTLTKTSTNGNATNFSAQDDNALVKAKDIAGNLNTLAGEIHTTKGTADTALQTFQVKKVNADGSDDDTNAITVGKDGTSGSKVNTLKLKGENGLTVATNKDGTVTFGINTQSGLKAGDSTTLNKDGLSIKNPTGNEQIQVGADGVKFAKVDKGAAGAAGAGIDGTSRITKDQIGFANSAGQVDINKPHLTKDKLKVGDVEITNTGINAGGKKITNIQSGDITQNSNDAVTGGKIYDLKTELESKISSTAKTAQNSLHEFSVADEQGNHFTVSNPYSSYDTSKTSDVITFVGENGITTKVNKGKVKVGIDQTKGLTTPKLTVGNNNGKGIVIDSKDGQNTITGLSNTLANVTNDGAGHALSQGLANDTDKTRAASIGDVLNAGFNLQGNGEAVDFVSTYDTVDFIDGNATTAKVTYDDTSKTSKVVYDVNVDDTTIEVKDKKLGVKTTTLTSTGTGANKFALSNQATGDALVKASDIVAHLNTLAGDIQTAKGASQANNSAGYVDADGNKVIYDSTDNKYYQAKNDGTVDKTKEVAKDKLVAQAQTPDGTLAQMNVKSVINKEQVNDANKKQGINEDNAFVKGLEKAASDNKTKNAAVTVGDLNAVAQTPLTFAGDTGTTAKKLGETLTIKGGQTDTNKLTDNNIGVVAGTDGFTVKLAKDLTNLNSVNAGGTKIDDKGVSFVDSSGQAKANTPVLSANGLDLGGKVISNVGKGTKDTDAANVQQLNEVRNLLGLGNAGNDNADGNQVNIADIKKDPNSGSSSNRTVIKAGTVLGGKGNNDTEKLATGGIQVGVDKDGNANGDLSNVWVKTQKDGSKKALLATYNAAGQTNYLTNNPAEAIDRINEQGIRFFHVNDGNQEPVVQGRNGIDSSAAGKHSVAIGFQALADGEAAVAIGRQTQAGSQSIAIGDKAQATGDQSIAIGTGNVVTGKHSGAIGDPSTVKADNSYSVGNNNQFTDATQTDVFGVGNNITVTESNSVALGSNSAISAGTHAGTQAKKSDGTAGTTTTAGATGTVKGFAGQTAVGAVSVGASGAERRIQNVAAGEVSATSTDAVNGSQLYKATQGIANATNELDHRIHQNENKANAGISSAMAMASMPQAYIPGRSMVTGGIATHNGQGAVAVGLSKLSDNGQWVFKINGSADTQGHVGAAVGAGFHF
ncbi:adhesin [Moraxella catarrhalis]|uniref:ESPR-type extended signal peptide-containing protein n=1 Tax=Moraxella catarrhalis TaxID=480 RepID=UPI00128BE0B8|nr:YadA-like family protein [Moraxella catarrhalis]MPX25049.1 adhesin [Moraxella catarrhalis]